MRVQWGNMIVEGEPATVYQTFAQQFAIWSADETPVQVGIDLEGFRAWALQEVERRRNEVIQEHCKPVYALKVADAQRVLAKQPSTLLAEEAAARGIAVTELATLVLQQHNAAQQVLARTEAWAARAKAAIQQAKDADMIVRILATEDWQTLLPSD